MINYVYIYIYRYVHTVNSFPHIKIGTYLTHIFVLNYAWNDVNLKLWMFVNVEYSDVAAKNGDFTTVQPPSSKLYNPPFVDHFPKNHWFSTSMATFTLGYVTNLQSKVWLVLGSSSKIWDFKPATCGFVVDFYTRPLLPLVWVRWRTSACILESSNMIIVNFPLISICTWLHNSQLMQKVHAMFFWHHGKSRGGYIYIHMYIYLYTFFFLHPSNGDGFHFRSLSISGRCTWYQ
jgi:hypothetical protein